ncbi:MAG: hypothetical protein ACYTF6_07025 [Planctomycetota bacterium]|jgi:hypothetical protein
MKNRARELSPLVMRPAARCLCVVMVCTDMSEAEQVARQLSEFDNGSLVTYRRVEDLKYNLPTERVALAILASGDSPSGLRRALKWLRHKWPRCPITVVGDLGCGQHEIAARKGGAMYLARPVAHENWAAILNHVLGSPRRGIGKARERFAVGKASRPINSR